MKPRIAADAGFSLAETVIATGVLTVGVLGLTGVLLQGMQKTASSPGDLIASQKAQEAIESVFSARDTQTITWAQIRNASQGGIFLDGPQAVRSDGADGVLGTSDDAATPIESIAFPGRDQLLGTADDTHQTLDTFTREIKITDLSDDLRSITVTIAYRVDAKVRTYILTAYISTFA
jgi:hypothetical protein